MSSMTGPALLVLTLIQLSVSTPTTRQCPTSFSLAAHYYNFCIGISHVLFPESVDGVEMLETLEGFCADIDNYKMCRDGIYAGCQADHVAFVNSLWERSTWMCDDAGHVRSVIADAINPSISDPIPAAQTTQDYCVARDMQGNCYQQSYSMFPSLLGRDNTSSMSVTEAFGNPASTRVFYELFDCAYQDVKEKCPHNALPITLVEYSHLLFPPKFGVNISDIILQTVDQNDAS